MHNSHSFYVFCHVSGTFLFGVHHCELSQAMTSTCSKKATEATIQPLVIFVNDIATKTYFTHLKNDLEHKGPRPLHAERVR